MSDRCLVRRACRRRVRPAPRREIVAGWTWRWSGRVVVRASKVPGDCRSWSHCAGIDQSVRRIGCLCMIVRSSCSLSIRSSTSTEYDRRASKHPVTKRPFMTWPTLFDYHPPCSLRISCLPDFHPHLAVYLHPARAFRPSTLSPCLQNHQQQLTQQHSTGRIGFPRTSSLSRSSNYAGPS